MVEISTGSLHSCPRLCCLATELRSSLRALSAAPLAPFTQRERDATALWLPHYTVSPLFPLPNVSSFSHIIKQNKNKNLQYPQGYFYLFNILRMKYIIPHIVLKA